MCLQRGPQFIIENQFKWRRLINNNTLIISSYCIIISRSLIGYFLSIVYRSELIFIACKIRRKVINNLSLDSCLSISRQLVLN